MSIHEAKVIQIKEILPHPDPETVRLGLVKVWDYQCVVGKDLWKVGDLAVYIEPDTMVDGNKPEFAFLNGTKPPQIHRIKAKRLRGTWSEGLLVPAPEGLKEGDDAWEVLGLARYVPTISRGKGSGRAANLDSEFGMGGEAEEAPIRLPFSKYDIENFKKYNSILVENETVVVTEKIHGCVPSNCSITMADGSTMKYSKVKVGDMVLGVDSSTGNISASKVIRKFNNGKMTEKWLNVKGKRRSAGKGTSNFSLTCTPNHEVWSSDVQAFIPANQLKVGSKVLTYRFGLEMTPIQKSILLGKMLGDGSIHLSKNTAAIRWGHTESDIDYVNWIEQGIGDIAARKDVAISGYGSKMIRQCTSFLFDIKEKFQSFIKNGKKVVPEWVEKELDPISLAFLFMDDGSLSAHQDQEDRASIAVCNFTKKDCEVIIRGLKKFNIAAQYKLYDGYSRLVFNSDEAEKLFLLIAPYIPKSMQRKLPERYRGHEGWIPKIENQYKKSLIELEISEISERDVKSNRFDMETETHNYFANTILVHNCNGRFLWADGRMWAGSRSHWKRRPELKTVETPDGPKTYMPKDNVWWQALDQNPWIEELCKALPNHIVFGEVFGQVQDLKYGAKQNEIFFRVFDIWSHEKKEWLSFHDVFNIGITVECKHVPILYIGPYSKEKIFELTDGSSAIDNAEHIREGVVIKPTTERIDARHGRVILKNVSNLYLERP